jgi:hypothetical protein
MLSPRLRRAACYPKIGVTEVDSTVWEMLQRVSMGLTDKGCDGRLPTYPALRSGGNIATQDVKTET